MQVELSPARPHRVAGVVAPLVARHDGRAGRQEVADLALALVASLGTDDRDVPVHVLPRLGEGRPPGRSHGPCLRPVAAGRAAAPTPAPSDRQWQKGGEIDARACASTRRTGRGRTPIGDRPSAPAPPPPGGHLATRRSSAASRGGGGTSPLLPSSGPPGAGSFSVPKRCFWRSGRRRGRRRPCGRTRTAPASPSGGGTATRRGRLPSRAVRPPSPGPPPRGAPPSFGSAPSTRRPLTTPHRRTEVGGSPGARRPRPAPVRWSAASFTGYMHQPSRTVKAASDAAAARRAVGDALAHEAAEAVQQHHREARPATPRGEKAEQPVKREEYGREERSVPRPELKGGENAARPGTPGAGSPRPPSPKRTPPTRGFSRARQHCPPVSGADGRAGTSPVSGRTASLD